jgi:hypothetical protein
MKNYRHAARESLRLANIELSSGDDQRLKYAALELRMSIESLTYDRAAAYKNEFPQTEYATWQPKKVMQVLLEIDPHAASDSSLRIGVEPFLGGSPDVMREVGHETALSMGTIKRHYDALGSYLHVPTLKQALAGKKLDMAKLRGKCEEIATALGLVLASAVYNITLGKFATLECGKCQSPIRRRFPVGKESVRAECIECQAAYTLVSLGNNKVRWDPHVRHLKCGGENCQVETLIWEHEVRVGEYWVCTGCNGQNSFCLGVLYSDPPGEPVQG